MASHRQLHYCRQVITIYTDGSAAVGKPKGGWAFVAHLPDEDKLFLRAGQRTELVTSQQMELVACQQALRHIKHPPATGSGAIHIVTDSNYLFMGITSWVAKWIEWEWTTAQGQPVKNKSLWVSIVKERDRVEALGWSITFAWTKGHASNAYNNLADSLAGEARQGKTTNRYTKRPESFHHP